MFRKFFQWIRLLFGGYGDDGYDRWGYDRRGYDRQGYDHRGFDRKRKHRLTGTWFDPDGYNSDGFDTDGEHRDYAQLKGHRISVLGRGVWQVDLHGMSARAAVSYIEDILDEEAGPEVESLVLIHGYRHGTKLKSMVRGMDHPRIKKIKTDMNNEGCTLYQLRKRWN